MLKRFPPLFLLAGLLICFCFLAAKAPMAAKQYDYVTITQVGGSLKIASTPDHFEQLRVKVEGDGNFGSLLTKINEYEAQGYELVNSNAFPTGSNGYMCDYVMLRRPKH